MICLLRYPPAGEKKYNNIENKSRHVLVLFVTYDKFAMSTRLFS